MELTALGVEGTDLLVHRLQDFWHSAAFSDLTVITTDRTFQVHRFMLCARSPVLCRLIAGEGREIHLTGQYALEMMDDHPRIVEAMLRSFYGLSYDGINKATNMMCPMLFNIMVYNIAAKYQIEYLKVQARLKFTCAIQNLWDSDDFLVAISQAYTTTSAEDRDLRVLIVAICQKHRRALREKQEFESLLANIPGLASDLLLLSRQYIYPTLALEPRIVESYVCMKCLSKWQIQVGIVKDFLKCPFCRHDEVLPF
ncbi:uncharacterized protein N7511_009768 [Penicillium nucicola]|uniref:uncharacterized protein n=1 Tax=Penicillium nucicola TaxID=1850975 RepID=UPI0025458BC8|nr:uncharacterized protein N7511_009768 [Penicillium nucicola]KAJ5748072.1 hypothetical protein N7511_009768 [Penicillium nucicola]